MVRALIMPIIVLCLLLPGPVAAQDTAFCGPIPEAPVCISRAEAAQPFASVEAADACQQAVRNYRDAVNLHVQCRTDETNAIVEQANRAIGRFNCRAEARTDCQENQ